MARGPRFLERLQSHNVLLVHLGHGLRLLLHHLRFNAIYATPVPGLVLAPLYVSLAMLALGRLLLAPRALLRAIYAMLVHGQQSHLLHRQVSVSIAMLEHGLL